MRSSRKRSPSPATSRRLGPEAERLVCRHYRLRGYRVLAANARAGRYELDLVVRRGRRLIFCEVKTRSGSEFGDPSEAVGTEKTRRVEQAALAWLARRPDLGDLDVRFEAVAVRGKRIERVPLH
jgi:putative endonuclease